MKRVDQLGNNASNTRADLLQFLPNLSENCPSFASWGEREGAYHPAALSYGRVGAFAPTMREVINARIHASDSLKETHRCS